MKKSILVVLSSLFFSGLVFASEENSWQVKSTEKQFDKLTVMDIQKFDAIAAPENVTTNLKQSSKQSMAKGLTARPTEKNLNPEFWIFDAWVEFHRDDDRDGYFNHFSVEFDADTEFREALVYARLYLGKNEVFQEFHVTSDFTIFSDSSADSFVVESELLNGFQTDDYEVLIELYDAYSHELVSAIDGYSDADLYLLALESQEYETVQVVVVTEHGGSLGLWVLLMLPLVALRIYSNKR